MLFFYKLLLNLEIKTFIPICQKKNDLCSDPAGEWQVVECVRDIFAQSLNTVLSKFLSV
jgi:hypothetical protein